MSISALPSSVLVSILLLLSPRTVLKGPAQTCVALPDAIEPYFEHLYNDAVVKYQGTLSINKTWTSLTVEVRQRYRILREAQAKVWVGTATEYQNR